MARELSKAEAEVVRTLQKGGDLFANTDSPKATAVLMRREDLPAWSLRFVRRVRLTTVRALEALGLLQAAPGRLSTAWSLTEAGKHERTDPLRWRYRCPDCGAVGRWRVDPELAACDGCNHYERREAGHETFFENNRGEYQDKCQ